MGDARGVTFSYNKLSGFVLGGDADGDDDFAADGPAGLADLNPFYQPVPFSLGIGLNDEALGSLPSAVQVRLALSVEPLLHCLAVAPAVGGKCLYAAGCQSYNSWAPITPGYASFV